MHYHHQNLTDGRQPLWRHGRAWWGRFHWGWTVFRRSTLGVELGRGRLSVGLGFASLYLRWAGGGVWEVSWHNGGLWVRTPWERQMEWRSSDPWWKKTIKLPVIDWLLGRDRCTTTKGTPFEVFIPMPEGSYRAMATPETRVWRRRWYVPQKRRDSVWLDIPGGIPCSGKGENSWDCGDDGLWGCGGDTLELAIGHAVASSLRDRRRYGHDSKGTGRKPALVVGAGAAAVPPGEKP